MSNKKTVYFLGAGFSKDAGGPIQNEIINTLLSDEFSSKYNSDTVVSDQLEMFKKFLNEIMCIPESHFRNISLEDVFTPIDRCIADGKSFGKHSLEKLVVIRENLHLLLALSIQYCVDKPNNNKKYINIFAKYINDICENKIGCKFDNDFVSIITTNWDILLDNSLNDAIKKTLSSNSEI